ncbi:MAG: hydroxyacid dehydrogenase [Deltaproteobacteria bacterium]|jgi:D-3-phosphoglycerate dehydrogenase|nr:hydroxyacid dehydrogenase [Deltaproteobacteria bacterium]
MAYKILISDKIEKNCLEIFQLHSFPYDEKTGLKEDELTSIIGGYSGLLVRSATKVTRAVLEAGKKGELKVVGRAGAGVDNIDVEAANMLGIKVINTPGLNANAVAELSIAYCFILARNLGYALSSTREGLWEKKKFNGTELMGKTLGLVGFGHIGRLVAQKAHGLGMKVLAYDPEVPADLIQKFGSYPVKLETVFKESDFISLHLPVDNSTKGMINEKVLKTFKKGAFLINCARGPLVDEDALHKALVDGTLGGAAVDVFIKEPPGETPLLKLPNFVASPHIGAATIEAQVAVAKQVAELVVEYLKSL